MWSYINVCVCCVVIMGEVLHNTSIQMCSNPDNEVHTVCMAYSGKTECAMNKNWSVHTMIKYLTMYIIRIVP